MTAKIKELAIAAGLIAPYGSDHEGLVNFDYRKFAELIIKECISQALDQLVNDKEIATEYDPLIKEFLKGSNLGVVDAVCAIKQHFGVE